MSNKVVICGVDTSQLPRLDSAAMLELVKKAQTQPEQYREEFVFANMRLVLSLVQRFCIKKEMVDDVFQIGVIGLLKAVDNFNTEVGVKFSTYAVPMIIGEIRRYLRDSSTMKVTRSLRDVAYRSMQSREHYNKLGIDPTNAMIATDIGATEKEVAEAMEAIAEPISLYDYAFTDNGEGIQLMDQLKDPKCNEDKWLENDAIQKAIASLNERERMILFLRYFEGKTQMEISSEIGISQAQVSRLEKNALAYMREYM